MAIIVNDDATIVCPTAVLWLVTTDVSTTRRECNVAALRQLK